MTTPDTPFATPEACWQAVCARDRAADGLFVYAVRTTGVYCRPSCPSRRALRTNVTFHADPAAAEAAGFRACKRCTPAAIGARDALVAQVMHLLDTQEPTPTLAALAARVGLSPDHVQKAFTRATGLSPRAYAAARKAQRLREGLAAGHDVTTATYDAGYGSARALYQAAAGELGMTPGALRRGGAGQRIGWATAESVLGPLVVAATARGVCALRFGEPAGVLAELAAEFPRAAIAPDEAAAGPHAAAAAAYLAGRTAALDLPLDAAATPFQARVWAALRTIPRGETRTYAEVARMIGEPSAVRAVARACATNPVALVVPCHRVVRTGGALAGYRWGLERKQALLAAERSAAAPRAGAGGT